MAYRGKHHVRTSNNTMKRIIAVIPIVVLILICYTITVFGWFQDSLVSSAKIKSGQYTAKIDILKDADGPASEDNLLWGSPENIISYDGNIELSDSRVTTAYISISNYSTSSLAFQYQIELTVDDKEIDLVCLNDNVESSSAGNSVINPAEVIKYRFNLPVGSDSGNIRLQLRTAFKNTSISTADSVDTLSQAKGTVYLTEDIVAEKSVLNISGNYPNINLSGHTLSVKDINIDAEKGVFTTMCIENGTLIIGSKMYGDKDNITVSGEGHVTVTLNRLNQDVTEGESGDSADSSKLAENIDVNSNSADSSVYKSESSSNISTGTSSLLSSKAENPSDTSESSLEVSSESTSHQSQDTNTEVCDGKNNENGEPLEDNSSESSLISSDEGSTSKDISSKEDAIASQISSDLVGNASLNENVNS